MTECSTPRCEEEALEDGKFCKPHQENLDRIRHELETDPKLLYRQRSDHPDRKIDDAKTFGKGKRRPRTPVCCVPGCFEERARTDSYCYEHRDFAGGD